MRLNPSSPKKKLLYAEATYSSCAQVSFFYLKLPNADLRQPPGQVTVMMAVGTMVTIAQDM